MKSSPSEFERRCHALLRQIPKGRVTTYKAIAEALGTKAYRAVGRAMGTNPDPVIVPCHRVVASNGTLGGYSPGIETKIALLESEGIRIERGRVVDFKRVAWSDFSV